MADNENENQKETAVEQGLEDVAKAASEVADAAAAAASSPVKKNPARTLDFILDVSLQVTVEVGRSRMTIHDLLQLGQGSVVELEKLAGEPLDIYINGKPVARGEAVIVNEKFGVRLTDIISPEDRIEGLEQAVG
jgi:flagellar motor switch protein FliN/FliY